MTLRRELEAKKWNAGETFADYLHDKVTLANRVPVMEDELISYVIEGIPNQELRTQAKVQYYQSLDALLTAFTDVPSLAKGVSRGPLTRHYGKLQTTMKNRLPDGGLRRQRGGDDQRCYNCNGAGHFAANCTKPTRERDSCYKCGKFGHRADRCDL